MLIVMANIARPPRTTGRITNHESAINHIVSFPEVKHVISKENG